MSDLVLTLNGGSSSLKFALYDLNSGARQLRGQYASLGQPDTPFSSAASDGSRSDVLLHLRDHGAATRHLIDWLGDQAGAIRAIGHRIVNGGIDRHEPVVIDQDVIAELEALSAFAPSHLPAELAVVDTCRKHLPGPLQMACFDTAFHRTMPEVARQLPLPRRLTQKGIQRFGFHGLSYAFVLAELARQAGDAAAAGRVVIAHLGNGSSLAAVRNGRSMDTTMGFTTAGGIPMATRSGDLDPGLGYYLARTEAMDAEAFYTMTTRESGLLGMSGTSGDVRQLLATQATDSRAAEALDHYCYRISQAIGALAVAIDGVDTLVFTGGIGEHAAEIRGRVCARLGFLGIRLDATANAGNHSLISPSGGTAVRVIPTDEEAVIFALARTTLATHQNSQESPSHG